MVYGDRELRAQAENGKPVHIIISSGMVGELVRAQNRQADGSPVDLAEQPDRI